jgi:hypothetical protein
VLSDSLKKNWMAPYIQFNTEKRKEAKTDFFVNFWELLNVQLFGKTTEQCRNRKDVQLVCDPGKLIAKPPLEEFRIVNENTVLIDRVKTKVKLNKPIYTGFCIFWNYQK